MRLNSGDIGLVLLLLASGVALVIWCGGLVSKCVSDFKAGLRDDDAKQLPV